MSSFAKNILSGSTNGRGILVVATGDPGTTIHTAVSGTTNFDEIWIYAVNSSSSSVSLTIEYGSNTNPNDYIFIVIPAYQGLVLVIPGLILNNATVVKAFASVASVVIIQGYVNNITS